MNPKFLASANGDRGCHYWDVETCGWVVGEHFEGGEQEFCFRHIKFAMFVGMSNGKHPLLPRLFPSLSTLDWRPLKCRICQIQQFGQSTSWNNQGALSHM